MTNVADKILSRVRANPLNKREKRPSDKPKLTFGRAMKYAFLPDFGSRIKDIGKRLGGFAYFLAQIFYSCRLIPAGHPTLQAANIGHFGFVDVISTAAANLQMRKENTDQIVMFAAVIISMVLLVANGLAIAAYTVLDVGTAFAADPGTTTTASGSMFAAPNPETDLGLKFLDLVFGTTSVPFFGPDGSARGGADPIKEALYHMLGLYSTAMMVVAVVIILYYAFTVVGESAMTGQPFGKRFNSFWAPIRLVVGLGLLVPIAGGLNAAQYITLYAAKMGSGFASYAWSGFVQKLAGSDLISNTTPYPSVSPLVASIVRFETCRAVVNKENYLTGVEVTPEAINPDNGRQTGTTIRWDKGGTGWQDLAIGAATVGGGAVGGAITAVAMPNNVPAACGEIFIPNQPQTVGDGNNTVTGSQELLSANKNMHDQYVAMVGQIIQNVRPKIEEVVNSGSLVDKSPEEAQKEPQFDELKVLSASTINAAIQITHTAVDTYKTAYQEKFKSQVSDRISKFDDKGWLGAGMFYTQIADLNGGLVNATKNTFPRVTGDIVALPSEEEMKEEDGSWGYDQVEGSAFDNETVRSMRKSIANITSAFVQGDNSEQGDARSFRQNWFTMYIIDLFGGEYLRNFRQSDASNPLADLTALGHGLMTKGLDSVTMIITMMALGGIASVVGSIASVLAVPVTGGLSLGWLAASVGAGVMSSILQSVGGFLIFAATIGMSVGAFLYYIIPLIPFIYFFFAVISWILEVIEAMVGLPLWALAHIRIDGDGLSGQAAQTGYMILFGILVRPFIILFALIISIILYTAGMIMLKETFGVFVGALGEGESGGEYSALDYVAYCAVYALLAFTMAMLVFKQSDQMPNNIMRWFGGSDPRYNDGQQDPAGNLREVGFAMGAIGSQLGNKVADGVAGVSKGIGEGVGSTMAGRIKGKQSDVVAGEANFNRYSSFRNTGMSHEDASSRMGQEQGISQQDLDKMRSRFEG